MRFCVLAAGLVLAAACGGKKKETPPAAAAARDAGAATASGPRDVGRCIGTLERAARLPAAERGGTIVRGCGLCTANWDPVIAADRADTGSPVDLQTVGATVEACGGFCTKQAATLFKQHLGDLTPGKPSTRPWKTLAAECGGTLHVEKGSERFASGAWFALFSINRKLVEMRATMPAVEQARLDAALDVMLLALPPVTAPGTGFVVPGGARRPGTPWRHVTITPDATFVGRLAFAQLHPQGLGIRDGGEPYPGARLASLDALAATLAAMTAAGAPPPPVLADRVDEPIVIAPRAADARMVTDALAALGSQRAFLAVAAPAPAALWRGLVAAHPLPLAAPAAAPPGPRLRLSLGTARIAIVDDKGAVLVSAPLPAEDKLLVERWTLAAIALARGHTVEIAAAEGKVDDLAAAFDAVATGGAVLAVPAPAGAPMTGRDLPAFDAAKLAAALGPAPAPGAPNPTRPPP